jgi:uncharacterized protein YejL (UPF0352 family)
MSCEEKLEIAKKLVSDLEHVLKEHHAPPSLSSGNGEIKGQ